MIQPFMGILEFPTTMASADFW